MVKFNLKGVSGGGGYRVQKRIHTANDGIGKGGVLVSCHPCSKHSGKDKHVAVTCDS